LENVKKAVAKFKGRLSTEVRRQEKLDMAEKRDFRKRKLLERYMIKILYR